MKMKWIAVSLLAMGLFILPVVGEISTPWLQQVQAEEANLHNKTIAVSGQGEVTVKPDVAHVHVGVQTTGKTALEAYQSNAETFSKIKAALLEENIADKDIQTIRFNAFPIYDYREGGRELTGYEVNHVLSVSYRDLESLGQFLDLLTEVGVNRIENIEYATEKKHEYELQALEKALANAREKADVLARGVGQTIKGAVHIQEGTGYNTPIFRTFAMEQMAADTTSAAGSMSIYTGELTITKQVQVIFQFE